MDLEVFADGDFFLGVATFTETFAFKCPSCRKVLASGRYAVTYTSEEEGTNITAFGSTALCCCDRLIAVPLFFDEEVHAKMEIARIQNRDDPESEFKPQVIPFKEIEPYMPAMAEAN